MRLFRGHDHRAAFQVPNANSSLLIDQADKPAVRAKSIGEHVAKLVGELHAELHRGPIVDTHDAILERSGECQEGFSIGREANPRDAGEPR